MTESDGEEIVAHAYELRHETDEEWDRMLNFTHSEEIWGEHETMHVRNVRSLVEKG